MSAEGTTTRPCSYQVPVAVVGGRGILGQQQTQLIELLEVERAEVGIFQLPYCFEFDRRVHTHTLCLDAQWAASG